MRQTKAKAIAFGTGALILSAVALFAALQQADSAPATGAVASESGVGDGGVRAAAEAGEARPEPSGEARREASREAGSEGPEASRGAPVGASQVPDSVLAAGREVYVEQDCSMCHSIAGEGSPRYPLDGVGSRLDADEIRLWIVDPQEARPGVRKPAFDDLPEPEVDALVAYLQSLTDE